MSTAYEYRKVYADCVTPEGEVCVLYLNYVRLAGVWTARASVEWYTASGRRELVHGLDHPALVDGDATLDRLPLDVQVPGGQFSMRLTPRLGGWTPPTGPPVEALTWKILAVRTDAVVTWGDRTWRGTGYVDFVAITRPTRLLGMKSLRWGRVHLPDRTVVLEHLDTQGGAAWDVGVDWALGEPAARPLAGPAELGADGSGSVPLHDGPLLLSPSRVLHDGNAFDPERVPRWIDRMAAEAIGGPTRETRWYGTATRGAASAPALYESVRFG